MQKREKITIVLIAFVVLAVLVAYLYINYGWFLSAKKVTISGTAHETKGGMIIVNGTLILDERLFQYVEKKVEIIGYIYYPKCGENEQCFNGPYMGKVISFRVIE